MKRAEGSGALIGVIKKGRGTKMKSVRKKSQEQENRIAKELNGGTTPGSGAVWQNRCYCNCNACQKTKP